MDSTNLKDLLLLGDNELDKYIKSNSKNKIGKCKGQSQKEKIKSL